MNDRLPLIDSFGRIHSSLRISVTDRCNIRCFYCMPNEDVAFRPREEILSFEEIVRVVRVLGRLGVHKIRITGGEPLVRTDIPSLIQSLKGLDGITEVALTSNAILLNDLAVPLKKAGLDRLNISLDTLRPDTFRQIARRDDLDRALAGIRASQHAGFETIRLNAVPIRDVNEDDIVPLARFAREGKLHLRFIEFMPLDAEDSWQRGRVVGTDEIMSLIESEFGPLQPADRHDPSQPATDFLYHDGLKIGFISPVTMPFCHNCNRLRLTAEGRIRNCLFSHQEWDVRDLLRNGGTDKEIEQRIRAAIREKKAGHGMDDPNFVKPDRAMYQIGG